MTDAPSKADLWERWIADHVLTDIRASDSPDPVRVIDATGGELTMGPEYDSYRLGRGDGDYLYLLYLIDEPIDSPADINPVYIGETSRIATRLRDHFAKLHDALPITEWEDDGSWGSFGKYDHIATVCDRTDSPLYAWVCDVDSIDEGPYGYPTYRQELEAKLVGLAHSYPDYNRVLANRDFVPNKVAHEMAQVGPKWVELEQNTSSNTQTDTPDKSRQGLATASKAELWYDWVDRTICRDIQDQSVQDPIPLFETDEDLDVALTESGSSTVLKRNDAIDARIRQEGKRCVHETGVRDGASGLLYVMYQRSAEDSSPHSIIPRYIGKAEAYGKKNELSANFEEIAKDRSGTRSFARWGDGSYWHVGELSETIFGTDSKKLSWASELFEQGTHRLKEQTYLWIRAWDENEFPGPYGYPAYLAEAEALLIGLAYEAYPGKLLNHNEIPADAPANQTDFEFEPAPN
jgi:hypothetical protein